MTTRILCVCLGNICRSPTAEAVLSAVLPGAEIDSAGTSDWHIGNPPYGPMQKAARVSGYDLSRLRARQVAPADFHGFDLILAMDRSNLGDLQAMAPPDGRAKLALFLEPLDGEGPDVPDPYYTRDFAGALRLIERGARAWAAQPQVASAVAPKAT